MVSVCLLSIIVVYVCLHGIYRLANIDDAWFLSFAYNHKVRGIESDTLFGTEPGGGGFGGSMFFGKSFSYLYGTVLNLMGWTKSAAHLISTLCIILSALCWSAILIHLKFSRHLASLFGLTFLLVEPFFGAANQARPDALSFLVVSSAFLLFLRRHYILAGVFASIAFEIHPVGISALLFMASATAAAIRKGQQHDKILSGPMIIGLMTGFAIGFIYYLALHGTYWHLLPEILLQGNSGVGKINNILFEYFSKRNTCAISPNLLSF
jgi:hypothetical protein